MPKTPTTATEFDAEFVEGLTRIFEERIVFNQVLGLKITSLKPGHVRGRIDMKRELIGHFSFNRIHGGVISAGLDAMGGLAVMAAIGARHMDEPPLQRLQRVLGHAEVQSALRVSVGVVDVPPRALLRTLEG